MTELLQTTSTRRNRWYNNYHFPLVPIIDVRQANEHNTKSVSVNWLFFKFWTLDAFQFEVALVADTHWGIGLTALLPYLRVVVCIPMPIKMQMWVQRNLWRKPAALNKQSI